MTFSIKMSVAYRHRPLVALLFMLGCVSTAWSSPPQSSTPLTLAESPSVLSLNGGTLTIVLANKHGFVIAADSRRTYPNGRYSDDSQKLFRLGPHSAMVIAGFAGNTGEPFLTEIAAEIVKKTSSYSDAISAKWVESVIGPPLRLLRIINEAEGGRPDALDCYVTLVRADQGGIPQILKFVFQANQSDERATISTFSGVTFQCLSSGITQVVDEVLTGAYSGTNTQLIAFSAALRNHREDLLSVAEMSKIATAFIEETSRLSSKVGGQIQIGTFEGNRKPIWRQRPFDRARPSLGGISFYIDNLGLRPSVTAAKPDEVVNVVREGLYPDTKISVDGNIYISSIFEDSQIETMSLSPLYWRNNLCIRSVWVRPLHKPVALDQHCLPLPHFGVQP